jgi:hypothetical protein
MVEFKSWEELSDLEQGQATFWDMYKDAFNFRPRHIDTSTWTMADFEREFAELGRTIEANHAAEQIAQAAAVEAFERRVAEMLTLGAKDIEMAMRWIHEAEGTQGDEDFLAWSLGLPYQYFRSN